ncbi:hypothetical protein GCM10028801_28710 [Nocardioides maradonensis]
MTAHRTITAPTYLTLADASEVVGQSQKTLRRRIAAGLLPAYRFGPRCIRVRLEDLESLGHRIPTTRRGE